VAQPVVVVFYTFTWAGRPKGNRQNQQRRQGKPQGQEKGQGRKPKGKPRGGKPEQKGARNYSSKPEKKDKIDPDNPFAAALMGLKDKS
jgi:ATP-dependent RNA helicase SUPV3L1/SUV3